MNNTTLHFVSTQGGKEVTFALNLADGNATLLITIGTQADAILDAEDTLSLLQWLEASRDEVSRLIRQQQASEQMRRVEDEGYDQEEL